MSLIQKNFKKTIKEVTKQFIKNITNNLAVLVDTDICDIENIKQFLYNKKMI